MNNTKERISFLWQQFIDDKATPNELDELFIYLKNHPDDEHSIMLLQHQFANHQPTDTGDKEFWEEKLKQILGTGQGTPVDNVSSIEYQASRTHRIHFIKTTWFRYAAAVIIMLGVGAYLWFNNTTSNPINSTNPTNPNSDITPGSNRALLTLANGQQIILDSTQGNIVKQGNLTVVNLAGKLDYEGVGTEVEFHTLSTPKGGQYQLVLPDGSKVWLNAASSITYPTTFTGKDRTVNITGEAYFEIAKDKEKIFHVKTIKEEITVLGTDFNINAYSDEVSSKTSLLEGAVKIGNFILKPGQAYIDGKVITTNVEQDIAWKEGLFNFEGMDTRAVVRQLGRWYDLDIAFEGNIPERKFGGEMPRDLNLSQVLKLLEKMEIHFKVEGRKLIIRP